MASSRVPDYLGRGLLANRPVSPNIGTTQCAIYVATDTDTIDAWDGSAWVLLARFSDVTTRWTVCKRTTVTSGSGATLTATNLVPVAAPGKTFLSRSGPSADFTDTTDTATNLLGALTGAGVNAGLPILVMNNSSYVMSLAGGSGVTLSGATDSGPVFTIGPNSSRSFDLVVTATGTPAITLYG